MTDHSAAKSSNISGHLSYNHMQSWRKNSGEGEADDAQFFVLLTAS